MWCLNFILFELYRSQMRKEKTLFFENWKRKDSVYLLPEFYNRGAGINGHTSIFPTRFVQKVYTMICKKEGWSPVRRRWTHESPGFSLIGVLPAQEQLEFQKDWADPYVYEIQMFVECKPQTDPRYPIPIHFSPFLPHSPSTTALDSALT